jgi:hypothetical protein
MNKKIQEAVASYARSFVVAAAALYGAGTTDSKTLLIAGLAAIIGPAIRAINPKDPAFGYVAELAEKETKKALKTKLAKADLKK